MSPEDFRELRYLAQRDARGRQSTCMGKDGFENHGKAMQAIGRRLKSARAHPYRCRYCGLWHIGTTIAPHYWGRDAEHKHAGGGR